MIFVEAELARLLTDLILMTFAIVVLVHAATRRKVVRPLYPLNGLVFIAMGTSVFVFVFIAGIFESYDLGTVFGLAPGSWPGMLPSISCGPCRGFRSCWC